MAPGMTVVVPTYNRCERLLRVLHALVGQSIDDGRFEVVVVDDGSTDGTAEAASGMSLPYDLRVLRQANAGPAAARNAGVREARAPLVLFLDDDVVPDQRLVAEHFATHAEKPGGVVIGPMRSLPVYRQAWVAWEQEKLEKQYQAMIDGVYAPTYRQFWTGNASVARDLVLDAGGFDVSLQRAEDIDLGARLAERGIRFWFNPAASGFHHAERSLASWSRMHEQYGRVEIAIHGRFGEEIALNTLAANWQRLHPATRGMVGACLGRSRATERCARLLSGMIVAADRFGGRRAALAACSLLANLRYWSGCSQQLGVDRLRAVFSRPPGMDAGRASIVAARPAVKGS